MEGDVVMEEETVFSIDEQWGNARGFGNIALLITSPPSFVPPPLNLHYSLVFDSSVGKEETPMDGDVAMEEEPLFSMDEQRGDTGGSGDIALLCANHVKFAMAEEMTEANSQTTEANSQPLVSFLNGTKICQSILFHLLPNPCPTDSISSSAVDWLRTRPNNLAVADNPVWQEWTVDAHKD